MTDRISASYAQSTRRGWLIFLGLWTLVGVALVIAGVVFRLFGLWIVGLPMVAVFGALLILAVRRFGNPLPVIVVGADGFHDRRLGAAIPWADIGGLKRQKSGSRIFLKIDVAEPKRFLGNAGWLARPMLKGNPKMGFPVLGSNLSGMDVPQDRIATVAEAWWADGGRGIR